MSEKIYACLLFLFPSAFRRRYEEEALRLFRDRLRDEQGICRRLRLIWDLLTDVVSALPQAYGNSYADTAPAASLAPDLDGIPSFQLLRREPIARGTIVFAGVLTLTVQAVFMYVIQRPTPYRPVEANRGLSPIEAVMERVRVDMADGEDLNASASASASGDTQRGVFSEGAAGQFTPPAQSVEEAGRADHRAVPVAERSAPASAGTEAARGKTQAVLGRTEVVWVPARKASFSNTRARVVAALSHPGWVRQPVAQSRPAGTVAEARSANTFSAQAPAARATDLSGEWALKSSAASTMPHWFVFSQYGAELRGTGGPGSTEQYPLLNGVVAGDSVKFELKARGNRFLCELRFQGKALQGTLSTDSTNRTQVNTVRLERVRQRRLTLSTSDGHLPR